jgi:hypothetical protein
MSSNLDYSYEPIVIIPDTPLPELDDIQEKTDEEVSLGSEKKSKNLPSTRSPNHVWQYYEKVVDNKGILIHIKCIYCGQKYGAKTSTGTLNDHFKKKHSKVQPEGAGSIEAAFNNSSQARIKSKGDQYLDILNNIIDWVIIECQPFRVVDGPSFKKMIASLNPKFQAPSRQTLRKKIDIKYEQTKKTIINILQVNFIQFINYI